MLSKFDAVLLIPGWGCPAQWLAGLGSQLAAHFDTQYHLVDLPGMGVDDHECTTLYESTSGAYNQLVDCWLSALSSQWLGKRLLIVGWSYGGMLASKLMYESLTCQENQSRLITLGSSSQFLADAQNVTESLVYMSMDTADAFYKRVEQDPTMALNYFLSLMARGEPRNRWMHLRSEIQSVTYADVNSFKRWLLCESLKHLYALRLQNEWSCLKSRGVLDALFFEQDSLMPSKPEICLDKAYHRMVGGHLAPVISSSDVSNKIINVLNSQSIQ